MGSGVFVSYRKSDDPGWAGRVRDALANHFGEDQVFFDVDSIRGGQRWEDALDSALEESATLVLVIGPNWLDRLRERAAAPDTDYHLREITTALDRGIAVYPVRVHGAPMPDLADLPDELRARLPALQWMEVYESLFAASMQRVIDDIEQSMDPDGTRPVRTASTPTADSPAPGTRARDEVTVAPWGTDADYQEIADAVAAVGPGATIRVQPGRYLKQVVLDRPVAIVGEGRGEVLLDSDAVPCLLSRTTGAVVRGLRIKSSAPARAVGIRVESGDLALEDVRVRAHWVPDSTGIVATGVGTRLVLGGSEVSSVAVGIRLEDGAEPRLERTTVDKATDHALVITGGADPRISGCSFRPAGTSTVLVADGGLGTIDDSAIGNGGLAAIEIRSGGAPTIRGNRGAPAVSTAASTAAALTSLPDRFVKGRSASAPAGDDKDRSGWTLLVADGGLGEIALADLAEVRITTAGDPTISGSSVPIVRGEGDGRGTFEACQIGQVVLATGASPTFRGGCTIAPERGVKITVDVSSGAAGTFEDCEIVGRNVRDGSPDPAVRSDGGAPVLRRCTVKNQGEGALWVEGGGSATVEGGELRCTVSGPAVVVADGSAEVRDAAVVRGGIRVREGGRAVLEGIQVEADPVAGGVIELHAGGQLDASDCTLRGPGLAAVRKVGRWIEARSDKVRGKAAGVLGAHPPVRLADGSTAAFAGCTFTGVGDLVVPDEGATFERCTVDGDPYPNP